MAFDELFTPALSSDPIDSYRFRNRWIAGESIQYEPSRIIFNRNSRDGSTMKLVVNGVERPVASEWRNEKLLTVLREHLGLPGTRFSCGIGQCGACVVHIDGVPTNSCLIPVATVVGAEVLTIEGLAAEDGTLHPIQQAWIDESVPQCGYCQSGQIMQALALLEKNKDPNDEDINRSMNANLCRCGTYDRIRKSIKK